MNQNIHGRSLVLHYHCQSFCIQRHRAQLKTGGLPLPKPRAHPQSLRFDTVAFSTHSSLEQGTHSIDSGYPDDRESGPSKRCRMSALSQTQSGTKSDALVRVKQSSSSNIVLRLWSQIVELLTPYSQLIRDIMASATKITTLRGF